MRVLKPMLAEEVPRPFSDPAWLFEVKWDGIRCLCARGRLLSRNGVDVTRQFPEVAAAAPDGLVLDGELVVAVSGRPDFDAVMDRFRLTSAARISGLAASRPAVLIAFDLLGGLDGDLLSLPFEQRRARLVASVPPGAALRVNAAVAGDGEGLWQTVLRHDWEGMVAKRRDAPYEPGRRSPAWRKVKNYRRLSALVVGWHGDGYLVVTPRDDPERPVATVISGVPRRLFEAVRSGEVRLPLPCVVRHVGATYKGRLREPSLQRLGQPDAAVGPRGGGG